MKDDQYFAVGGVGGSGTRLVADVLRRLGFYIGPVQNRALDCLLFTLFFRRPAWFAAFPSETEILAASGHFIAAMKGGLAAQIEPFGQTNFDRLLDDLERFPHATGMTAEEISAMRAAPAPELDRFGGLAWKEPNTHMFLPQLAECFPRLKYVHVIRNGLDMAFSQNLYQLYNWGGFFGIRPTEDEDPRVTQLRFWVAANRRAVDFGETRMPNRFLLLNYDALCEGPERELGRLVRFFGKEPHEQLITELAESVAPTSRHRYRAEAADFFDDELLAAVRAFDFEVE